MSCMSSCAFFRNLYPISDFSEADLFLVLLSILCHSCSSGQAFKLLNQSSLINDLGLYISTHSFSKGSLNLCSLFLNCCLNALAASLLTSLAFVYRISFPLSSNEQILFRMIDLCSLLSKEFIKRF